MKKLCCVQLNAISCIPSMFSVVFYLVLVAAAAAAVAVRQYAF